MNKKVFSIILSVTFYFSCSTSFSQHFGIRSLYSDNNNTINNLTNLLYSLTPQKQFPTIYVDSIISGQGAQRNKWTLEYSEGKISAFVQWYLAEGQWKVCSRFLINYDSAGNVVSKLRQDFTENGWISQYKDSSVYDLNNNEVKYFSGCYSNEQWLCTSRATYEYNEYNKRIFALMEEWKNNSWVKTERLFIYYTGMNTDSIINQIWNNGWNNLSAGWFVYEDPNVNNYTSYSIKIWNGTEWINNLQGSFKYDSSGNLEYTLWEQWDGSQWINNNRYFYSYNSANLTTYIYCEIWDNGSWVSGVGTLEINWVVAQFRLLIGAECLSVYYKITSIQENISAEKKYKLYQNYPNPFNPLTIIKYSLPSDDHLSLTIYDILGNEIETLVNEYKRSGTYEITFDGSKLSSGVYICVFRTNNHILTRKLILQK